jgi:hypothetical protein
VPRGRFEHLLPTGVLAGPAEAPTTRLRRHAALRRLGSDLHTDQISIETYTDDVERVRKELGEGVLPNVPVMDRLSRSGVAHYLFNFVKEDAAPRPALRDEAAGFLRARMWGIDADERHADALAAGDLVLLYLGAPDRAFIGRAALASAVHEWTPAEAQVYPGVSPGGVLMAQVEEWDPPVLMSTVLSQIDQSEGARADFDAGVVRITAHEYETALAVAAMYASS